MKRTFDIFVSLLIVLLLLPTVLCIVIWIIFDSKGFPIYSQVRVGKDRRCVRRYKFRTMYVGAEQKGLLTVGYDPRITRAGRILRKYKLDELPQLWNILRGEMSLVGPRPEVPSYVALYSEEQKTVLTVRPGLTDFASLQYFDENTLLGNTIDPEKEYIEKIMPAKLSLNLEYIRRQSLATDFGILVQTVRRILQV